ncbi:hypothetical protein EON63_03075 [archaeon]|nr:MAG: hypothetical protein EON63_03075 [archaeon]
MRMWCHSPYHSAYSLLHLTFPFIIIISFLPFQPLFRPQEGVKIAASDEELKSEAQGSGVGGDIDTVCEGIIRYGVWA